MTGEKIAVIGAGRTDAGVHARGQVANFHSHTRRSCYELMGSLNSMLPEDIVVLDVRDVPPEFHARYSALGRRYSYRIIRKPSALLRSTSWLVQYPLDLNPMREAARHLVGDHDFRSFCRVIARVEHHRCTVTSAIWLEEPDGLLFIITANRFLHGMVRTIVGTMVDIGRGALTITEFDTIIAQKDRTEAGMTAPARGLVLENVFYGDETDLPAELQT